MFPQVSDNLRFALPAERNLLHPGVFLGKRQRILRLLQAARGGVVTYRLLTDWSQSLEGSLPSHINALRIHGHDIQGVRCVGYRLVQP